MAGLRLDQPSTSVILQTSLHLLLCEQDYAKRSSFCLLSLLFSVITVIIISILIWQCRTLHILYVLEHLLVANLQTQQQ